jgi:hypothetical protein
MSCDKLSPRPSPQHSKSLSAPPDCTNCSKQQANPINNYISKWKYKEDLAKPHNMKRARPRKQPQTTYHFPLSHCSVNTFNPNNKLNEDKETSPPSTPDSMSPTESPRDISPREPSPRSPREHSPRNNLSSITSLSPRSSPRHVSREVLLKQHRVHMQDQLQQRRHDERDEQLPHSHSHSHSYDYHMPATSFDQPQRTHETAVDGQPYDYHMSSPKKHRRTSSSPADPSFHARTIYSICNPYPTADPPLSPLSSDDNDENYSSDPSPHTGNYVVRDSRKRRSSEERMVCETIEISDGESDLVTPHYHNAYSYQSRRLTTLDPPHSPPISLHPLSLNTAYNDLAKYHLGPKPSLPPLNFARLPIDDSDPRLHSEHVRHQRGGHSFPNHYSA